MTKKKWIQEATKPKNKGKLREYVRNRYGSDGFTKNGNIKTTILHQIIRDPDVSMTTRKRAQFALNVRGLRQHMRRPKLPKKRK